MDVDSCATFECNNVSKFIFFLIMVAVSGTHSILTDQKSCERTKPFTIQKLYFPKDNDFF